MRTVTIFGTFRWYRVRFASFPLNWGEGGGRGGGGGHELKIQTNKFHSWVTSESSSYSDSEANFVRSSMRVTRSTLQLGNFVNWIHDFAYGDRNRRKKEKRRRRREEQTNKMERKLGSAKFIKLLTQELALRLISIVSIFIRERKLRYLPGTENEYIC